MKTYLVGPLLAALAMFVWGFLYYGISSFPYQPLGAAGDVGPALDELFPASGVYLVPDPRGEPDVVQSQMQRGPMVTVHIRKGEGKTMDPAMMLGGFVHEFLSCALMAMLLVRSAARNYVGRVCFVVIVGILITVFGHGGQAIWWQQDWSWHLRGMLYETIGWAFAGLILARFAHSASVPSS